MPIIVNSQPQLEKTNEYRLSIQADLNGFSFSVLNKTDNQLLFLYGPDFNPSKEDEYTLIRNTASLFESMPLLRQEFDSTTLLYNTHKFTCIPRQIHKKGDELSALKRLFQIEDLEEINTVTLEEQEMVLIYAANSTMLNKIKEYQPNISLYPSIYLYLRYLPLFKEHNKIFFQYIKDKVIITIAEGNKILLCNSYPAQHFNSALYFLLLALKEVQFNPEHTTVYISGNIRDLEILDISKYFSSVKYFRNPETPLPDINAELRYSSLTFPL
jgi:hypothetical protein